MSAPGPEDEDDPGGAGQPLRALIGLLALAILIGLVVVIIGHLRQAAAIQDCVAAGRSNCAPIAAPARG